MNMHLLLWQHAYKTAYYVGDNFAVLVGEYDGEVFSILPLAKKEDLPKVIDVYCLKYQRTEYAKKIRKEYEAGKIKERRCNMREYTFRTDGCSNTITTVQKDNYIAEINK